MEHSANREGVLWNVEREIPKGNTCQCLLSSVRKERLGVFLNVFQVEAWNLLAGHEI